MALIRCIYASTAADSAGDGRDELLETARRNNARFGITGMLLAVDDRFIQIIEGEADHVDELFLHIAGDARHRNVTEIVRELIPARQFGHAHLGYRAIAASDVCRNPALLPICPKLSAPDELDADSATRLLTTFAEAAAGGS